MSRIAVIADFLEEKWPSMDLAAEQLAAHLREIPDVHSVLIRPPLRTKRNGAAATALDRALGRFVQLPAELTLTRARADYYHIADHSYAHLALLFPRDRVGVYCHDIDAFRALIPGSNASRSRVLLSRILLKGLRHAKVVFHSTQAVRQEILQHGFLPATRLVHAPYGVAAEFLAAPKCERTARRYLLHVGSCIPRKNIEHLLRVFAAAHENDPELQLVQVGGRWTDAQQAFLDGQRLGPHVSQRRGISREELAALYAGAAAVLVPSLSEGFGLPVIEALACGAPVIASDIAVLREVGFQGVLFCSPSAVDEWTRTIQRVLATGERVSEETQESIRARYSWLAHAKAIKDAYAIAARRS